LCCRKKQNATTEIIQKRHRGSEDVHREAGKEKNAKGNHTTKDITPHAKGTSQGGTKKDELSSGSKMTEPVGHQRQENHKRSKTMLTHGMKGGLAGGFGKGIIKVLAT